MFDDKNKSSGSRANRFVVAFYCWIAWSDQAVAVSMDWSQRSAEAQAEGKTADAVIFRQRAQALNAEMFGLPSSLGFVGTGWVAVGAGYDSNINSMTDESRFYIPKTQATYSTDTPLLRSAESTLLSFNVGKKNALLLGGGHQIFLSAQAGLRVYTEHMIYLPHQWQLGAGWEVNHPDMAYGVRFYTGHQWLLIYRAAEQQIAESYTRQKLSDHLNGEFVLRQRDSRYPYFTDRVIQENTLRLSLSSSLSGLGGAIEVGESHANTGGTEFARDVHSYQLFWQRRFGRHVLGTLGAITNSHYRHISPLFLRRRKDVNTFAVVSLDTALKGDWFAWRLISKLVWECNESNISLSDYARAQLLFEMRRGF